MTIRHRNRAVRNVLPHAWQSGDFQPRYGTKAERRKKREQRIRDRREAKLMRQAQAGRVFVGAVAS